MGHRWGNNDTKVEEAEDEGEALKPRDRIASEVGSGKGQLVLRGPHQEKKTKNLVDEKKAKLAMSIFGKKPKKI